MKKSNFLKVITITTAVLLISLISFLGIYLREKHTMKNIIPAYSFGTNLSEVLYLKLELNTEVEQAATAENFKLAKEILEKRLNAYGAPEYQIRQSEDGAFALELANTALTEDILTGLFNVGKFEVRDAETEEVLMSNHHIKEVSVNSTEDQDGNGVILFLQFEFNEEGTEKFKEITGTYTTESEKEIAVYIDDSELLITNFSETMEDGIMHISYSASKDTSVLQSNYTQALTIATILGNGTMPLQYTVTNTNYVKSNLDSDVMRTMIAICIVAILVIYACILVTYKLEGAMLFLTTISYLALLLIGIRYMRVVISVESLIAIALGTATQIAVGLQILKKLKNRNTTNQIEIKTVVQETILKFLKTTATLSIVYIVLCFINWNAINSFGMMMFWQTIFMLFANFVVLKELLKGVR